MQPDLMRQFIEYQTSRELWNGISETYRSGEDALQIYDLNIQATRLVQGEQSLERYYQACQAIWREIDRRDPNEMETANDILKYNKKIQTFRLYQFIHGADAAFDAVKRDLLKETPLPTVEMAYSALRREAARVIIVNRSTTASDEIGTGLMARNQKTYQASKSANPRPQPKTGTQTAAVPPPEKSKMKCDHCNKMGHLKEKCFEIIGYPDWYENNPKFSGKPKRGTAATASGTAAPSHFGSSTAEDGDELGFAALASRRGGNRRVSESGPRREAAAHKRPRLSQPPSRGNQSRPSTAATAQTGMKSGGAETLDRGVQIEEKVEDVNSGPLNPTGFLIPTGLSGLHVDTTGPFKENGLSVPLGPSDMMGIHEDDSLDGLDILNNTDDEGGLDKEEQSVFTGLDDLEAQKPTKDPSTEKI
ncbi:hypothetical protein CASFOL_013467 [Castilleja foliolosa]|uniref:Retrotransposon gag domain-containing protein n=1 Tax=Castilleja foliolosa TaxID=1961234 RepID=A0ABD3DLW8_9LAMI